METIQSRYLKLDFTFEPSTMQRNDGHMTIIPHNVLWDIIHNKIPKEQGTTYEYIPVSVTREHCFIGCVMTDKQGRKVQEYGESTSDTLTSKIAKGIPATMAQIRAFDRAAIKYLDFACDGKVYSDQEIPESEWGKPAGKATAPKAAEKTTDTPAAETATATALTEAIVPVAAKTESAPDSSPASKNIENAVPEIKNPMATAKPDTAPPVKWQNGDIKKQVLEAVGEHSEIIIFDTETSGLKASEERILELSAKKYSIAGENLTLLDELHTYIKPPFAIKPEITAINGISDELLADKPVEEDAFVDIFNFFGEKPPLVAAYNTPFDMNFMRELYQRQEKSFVPLCQLDVLDMARDLVKDVPNHKLETVATKYGLQGDDFHTATFDTDCTAKLFEIFLQEYLSGNPAAEAADSESGKIRPEIRSLSLFDRNAKLRRIYVNTSSGTLYYDLVKHEWGSKDAKMETLDMAYVEKEAWICAGVAGQRDFEKFKGSWSKTAAAA